MKKYLAYFISDGTGITAEALGRSILTQFDYLNFQTITCPFIDSIDKAQETIAQIAASDDGNTQIIIFDTIIDRNIRAVIAQSKGYMVDIFATFISPLEKVLEAKSSYSTGKSHTIMQNNRYKNRIEAVNFALNNDDGISTVSYNQADIVLIGASRSGKTPTCLYLAMQFGVKAANYPLVEEDLTTNILPGCLLPYKDKLFGLIVDPQALADIRNHRRANSRYSSLAQCESECKSLHKIYAEQQLMYLDSTKLSIEEISTRILAMADIKRRPV
jgi:[pyruvate, water dikinase]-phosphate phosphotransferase / [pyruvate, water dikinase] kinase